MHLPPTATLDAEVSSLRVAPSGTVRLSTCSANPLLKKRVEAPDPFQVMTPSTTEGEVGVLTGTSAKPSGFSWDRDTPTWGRLDN
eukprot:3284969-Amphidinium_carterae.1